MTDLPRSRTAEPALVVLFTAAAFTSALLLFLIQPMFGKLVLPLLGGSPSVWSACMLFFQSALLAGYLYAHVAFRVGMRWQLVLHGLLVLAGLMLLPIDLPEYQASNLGGPFIWLWRLFLVSIGLPFFVLATSAPLLQRWFGMTRHAAAGDPYFLYAASNAGSLMALLLYPAIIEPSIRLRAQLEAWAVGYVAVGGLMLACAVTALARSPGTTSPGSRRDGGVHSPGTAVSDAAPGALRCLRWTALSFVPSSLMLAVTSHLSTDVAVVPLLWIVPFSVYLLTYVLAFTSRNGAAQRVAGRVFPLVLLPVVTLLIAQAGAPQWFMLPLHLLTFSGMAMVCHGRMADDRPPVQHLTRFYLHVAVGGMLGGIFNTMIAPLVFTGIAEYPLSLVLGCAVVVSAAEARAVFQRRRSWVRPVAAGAIVAAVLVSGDALRWPPAVLVLLIGAGAVVCFSVSREAARFALGIASMLAAGALFGNAGWGEVLYAERTFFGVYRVSVEPDSGFLALFHGTTIHGRQARGATRPEPLTYYHRASPIGDVMAAVDQRTTVGVVGLGVGSLAAYARPGDHWTFYEIDPAVERIARDRRFFSFLEACGSTCLVVLGDARLSLDASQQVHDLLVLDAFSSDAIPVHLLTSEALATYLSRLAPHGRLAFHVSNNHLDLVPVLARLAHAFGLASAWRLDVVEPSRTGNSSSLWVAMARRREDLGAIAADQRWKALGSDSRPAWSDDFSNIWTAIKWR